MANARVLTHPKSGKVLLEYIVNGKRVRLSTGQTADKRLLGWYTVHAEKEFWKLYYSKFGEDLSNAVLFKDYGKTIVEVTKGNRNSFSQKVEEGKLTTLNKFFGEMSLDRIKPTTIQEWQSLTQEIRSPKTIREYRSTLNTIFEFALDDEIIRKNPLKRVKPPKMIRREVEFFTKKERETILQNSDEQLHSLFQLAFIVKENLDINVYSVFRKPENYKEMSIEAMEKTGMTPEKLEEIADENAFNEKFNYLTELLEDENNVLYIHNAQFDLEVLKRKGLVPKCKVICTLRFANVLNDMLKLPFKSTRLSYLHYYYRNDLKTNSNNFHTADFDCLCLLHLVQYWKNNINFDVNLAVKITNNPIQYTYCSFGKNRGMRWVDMTSGQLNYFNGLGDKDICYTIRQLSMKGN